MNLSNRAYNALATLVVALPLIAIGLALSRGNILPGVEANRSVELVEAKTVSAPLKKIEPFQKPYVSITFDDGWESSYTNGTPLLGDFNMPATFYVMSGSFGDYKYLAIEQGKHLAELGHQIASHTVTHADLTALGDDAVSYELRDAKRFLELHFGTIEDFASPYNRYNDKILSEIKELYRSHRNTNGLLNTPESFDMYDINSYSITSSTTLDDLKNWLANAQRQNSWLVLNYHQIEDTGAEYALSPAEFEDHLKVIMQSKVETVRIDEFLDALPNSQGGRSG